MIPLFNSITNKEVCYSGDLYDQRVCYPLKDLNRSFRPVDSMMLRSTYVQKLAEEPWSEPHHYCHLAGLIKKLYPAIKWGWQTQIYVIEIQKGNDRLYPQFIKERHPKLKLKHLKPEERKPSNRSCLNMVAGLKVWLKLENGLNY